jgi:carboxymethylenebutenolidase
MEARWDTVEVGGVSMPVYVAVPDGDGPFPAVVVNQGLGSVEEVIQALTRWVAESGFVAAAPVYYHRQKDNILEEVRGMTPGSPERVKRLFEKVQQLRDDQVIGDGRAAVDHLKGLPNVDSANVGVIGFCLGGRITYLQSSVIEDFKASVPFYPAGLWTSWGDGPSAFERLAGIRCPVLGLFGLEDGNPSPEEVSKLDAELTRLNKQHEFHSYQAGHDFQNYKSKGYNEQAASDSWPVAMGFLAEHLRAPAGR